MLKVSIKSGEVQSEPVDRVVFMTRIKLILVLMLVSLCCGCASMMLNIEDRSDVYNAPLIKGIDRVVVTDFKDLRREQNYVGRVGLGYTQINPPVTVLLTDSIARILQKNKLNVDKLMISKLGKQEISDVLKANSAKFLISGGLEYFYFSSIDAVMQSAKGKVEFYIEIFNDEGARVFYRRYSADNSRWVGFAVFDKEVDLVGGMVDESSIVPFSDKDFLKVLGLPEKESNLSSEVEKLGELHAAGYLSDDEFKSAKRKLLGL